MSGKSMKRGYIKNEPGYEGPSEFEADKILAAARRLKKRRKFPTSVALEDWTIKELKALAHLRGVPYQVLMRMFILDGLHRSHTPPARR